MTASGVDVGAIADLGEDEIEPLTADNAAIAAAEGPPPEPQPLASANQAASPESAAAPA